MGPWLLVVAYLVAVAAGGGLVAVLAATVWWALTAGRRWRA